jgi:hypothetical protein
MFKLPRHDQRLAIVGHTGSGKTQFAAWVLSHQNLSARPWVIVDYKHDALLNSIDKIRELPVTAKRIPRKGGLYITHPLPSEEDEIESLMWKIWARGNTGLYIDEGHMLPNRGALAAIATQGRSLGIPMIVLTQRPRWTSRFVFSEADYISAFHLTYPDDRRFVAGILNADLSEPLPEYHSRYHSIAKHTTYNLLPVGNADSIRNRIENQLRPHTWWS